MEVFIVGEGLDARISEQACLRPLPNDTLRGRRGLEELWANGQAPRKLW